MTDNYKFDISGGGKLDTALAVAFALHEKTVGYRIDGGRMVFYWAYSGKSTPFPAPLNKEQVEEIIVAWLKSVDYGPEPDIDGHLGKGFRIYNESWAQVGNEFQTFFAVEPEWLLYGK